MDAKTFFKRITLFTACLFTFSTYAFHTGIYVTQPTAESNKLTNLIANAKRAGIDTFVVDAERSSNSYANAINKIRNSGLYYVARVVVFPSGGNDAQIRNKGIWEKKLKLMQYAASLGASAIQLDYIRYSSNSYSSPKKAHTVLEVVKYFRDHLSKSVELQADIFGVAAHAPSNTIGQNAKLFKQYVDTLCPMVYPSHYEPYRVHAFRPYQTVHHSVSALNKQLEGASTNVIPWIETYNYRVPMSIEKRREYIKAQIKAVKDAGGHGFYVWNPNNTYNVLFSVL